MLLVLVDSGSYACFLSSNMVRRLGVNTKPCKPAVVKVANGDTLLSNTYIPVVEWWANGHTYHTTMRVLDLDAYDAIWGLIG